MRHTNDMTRSLTILAVLAIILAACAATGSGGSPSADPSPTPTVGEGPSSDPSPTHQPAPTPASTPEPTHQPAPTPRADIPIDTVVATAVEGLNLRRDAGIGGERIGFLELGTVGYVLDGPTEVDGMPWYLITGMGLPYASGCVPPPPDAPIACPAYLGWVAGASDTGDPWLVPADAAPCPDPSIRSITDGGWTNRLICWSDGPITFDAFWPAEAVDSGNDTPCPTDAPGGWLYCEWRNPNGLAASRSEANTGVVRMVLAIEPGSGVEMPRRDQAIRVTGSFDHPSAAECAALASGVEPENAAFRCRLQFVPTSVEALGG